MHSTVHTYIQQSIHTYIHNAIHAFNSPYMHSTVHTYIHQSIRTSFPHTSQVLRYDVIRGIWSILEEQIAGSKLTLFWLKILTNAEGLLLPLSPDRFLYYFWRRKKCSASATDVDVVDKCNDIEDRTSKKQSGYCSLKKHWERERERERANTLRLWFWWSLCEEHSANSICLGASWTSLEEECFKRGGLCMASMGPKFVT